MNKQNAVTGSPTTWDKVRTAMQGFTKPTIRGLPFSLTALPVLAGVGGYALSPAPYGMTEAMYRGSPLEKEQRKFWGFGAAGAVPGALIGSRLGAGVLGKLLGAGAGTAMGWLGGQTLRESLMGARKLTPEMLGYGLGTYREGRPHAQYIDPALWQAHGYPARE